MQGATLEQSLAYGGHSFCLIGKVFAVGLICIDDFFFLRAKKL